MLPGSLAHCVSSISPVQVGRRTEQKAKVKVKVVAAGERERESMRHSPDLLMATLICEAARGHSFITSLAGNAAWKSLSLVRNQSHFPRLVIHAFFSLYLFPPHLHSTSLAIHPFQHIHLPIHLSSMAPSTPERQLEKLLRKVKKSAGVTRPDSGATIAKTAGGKRRLEELFKEELGEEGARFLVSMSVSSRVSIANIDTGKHIQHTCCLACIRPVPRIRHTSRISCR